MHGPPQPRVRTWSVAAVLPMNNGGAMTNASANLSSDYGLHAVPLEAVQAKKPRPMQRIQHVRFVTPGLAMQSLDGHVFISASLDNFVGNLSHDSLLVIVTSPSPLVPPPPTPGPTPKAPTPAPAPTPPTPDTPDTTHAHNMHGWC
jgi:hypothetical protein